MSSIFFKRVCAIGAFVSVHLIVSGQYIVSGIEVWSLINPNPKLIQPSVEFSFLKKFSVGLTYETGKYQRRLLEEDVDEFREVYNITGWGLSPEFRFYPSRYRRAPEGFFLGAKFSYRDIAETYAGNAFRATVPFLTHTYTRGTTRGAGLKVGMQAFLWHLAMESKFGLLLDKVTWDNPSKRHLIHPQYARGDYQLTLTFETRVGLMFPKLKTNTVLSGAVPSVKDESSLSLTHAVVILYRPKQRFGRKYKHEVYLHDSLLVGIGNAESHILQVPTGRAHFRGKKKYMRSITFNVEAGHMYYLKCIMAGGLIVKEPFFEIMEPAKAEQELAKLVRQSEKTEKKKPAPK